MKRLAGLIAMGVTLWPCGESSTEPPPPEKVVTAVQVTPSSTTLFSLGETAQLVATAHDAGGTVITGKAFTWTSSVEHVATVNEDGLVSAASNGSSTITATTEGIQGSALLTVAQSVASVSVAPASTTLVALGETVQLTASALDANGNAIHGKPIAWSSDDQSVATVTSSGLVTAVANGSVAITATADGNSAVATILVDQVGTHLEFMAEPTGWKAGASSAPGVEVAIRDALGNLVRDGNDAITLTIGTNPSGATLSGTTMVDAAAGIAMFGDLSIDGVGSGYTLVATSGGLSGATSQSFRVGTCPCAYVANESSGTVSVIELATNLVIGTVAVGSNPAGVAVTPDAASAYVTSAASGTVSVIDIASDTVVAVVDLGYGPVGVALTPDGAFAYTADRFGTFTGPVSVIETASNTVVDAIDVGNDPFGVAITPNGALVYVTNAANTVSVIETAGNTVVATVRGLRGSPRGVAFTPDGALAYVATNEPGNVFVIETATHTVVDTIALGLSSIAGSVAISPDGSLVYVTGDDEIVEIETASNMVLARIAVEHLPSAVAVTPDGAFLYVTHWLSPGLVSVIETATNYLVASIGVGGRPTAVAVTP
jgi:YVTN family beta-propeller protein